jgi:hypothetical protein
MMDILRMYLGIIILLISFSCNSQTKELYQSFSEKFEICDLPIKGEELPKGNDISKEEFDLFVRDSELWKYAEDYYYNASVKFSLKGGIYALIYIRSFYPESIENEKMEFVLVTFDCDGKKISSLPLHGISGDEFSFYGKIDQDYQISISSQKYVLDEDTGESITVLNELKYQIQKDSGEISILE